MFSKLANKLSEKLDIHDDDDRKGAASQQQQQLFQGGGGGQWSRTPLGTGSKAEIYRHRYWRGVNFGEFISRKFERLG